MTINKAKTINGKLCIGCLVLGNNFEWVQIAPRRVISKRNWRYICTDYELSHCDIYEDKESGEMFAVNTY